MAEKLKMFRWSGVSKEGVRSNGKIQAFDLIRAQSELKSRGIEIIKIKEEKELFSISLFQARITMKDILYFSRYLSALISSGIPILQAFDIIAKDQENEALRTMISSIRDNVASGKTLAES